MAAAAVALHGPACCTIGVGGADGICDGGGGDAATDGGAKRPLERDGEAAPPAVGPKRARPLAADAPLAGTRQPVPPAPQALPSICEAPSVDAAAASLSGAACAAAVVRRPLAPAVAKSFAGYLAARPTWPGAADLHPLEATVDRIAVIDFAMAAQGCPGRALDAAVGYGRDLPPRGSPDAASAASALAEIARVLPAALADAVAADAAELLSALWAHTNRRQFVVRLELVRGDTCQKWHSDNNIARCIITYVGPGTLCAHERGVIRDADGGVASVSQDAAVQMAAGDVLLMKGGLWAGSCGRGTAHRAPSIGPVQSCDDHRLMLKVDVCEDF